MDLPKWLYLTYKRGDIKPYLRQQVRYYKSNLVNNTSHKLYLMITLYSTIQPNTPSTGQEFTSVGCPHEVFQRS